MTPTETHRQALDACQRAARERARRLDAGDMAGAVRAQARVIAAREIAAMAATEIEALAPMRGAA